MAPPPSYDNIMMWAVASACFFGFFRAGELTVPGGLAFDATMHLAWGDVTVDSASRPSKICFLRDRRRTSLARE